MSPGKLLLWLIAQTVKMLAPAFKSELCWLQLPALGLVTPQAAELKSCGVRHPLLRSLPADHAAARLPLLLPLVLSILCDQGAIYFQAPIPRWTCTGVRKPAHSYLAA